MLDYSGALVALKGGAQVARAGWNGKGIFIQVQFTDENSFMTSPYIYIDSSGLLSDNPDSPKNRVPWTPSQTDMFAEDWVLV